MNRRAYLIAAGLLFGLAVLVCAQSVTLVIWTPIGPGPGFFTVIMGAILGILAVALAVEHWKKPIEVASDQSAVDTTPSSEAQPVSDVVPGSDTKTGPRLDVGSRRVVLLFLGLAAVLVFFELLGYRFTIFLLLAYLLVVIEKRRLVSSVAIAVVLSAASFYVFSDLLSVPLPISVVGI